MEKKSATLRKCKVCGEDLEMLFPNGPVFGMDRHPRMCACMRTKQEEEAKARAEREQAEIISRNRSICFSDKKMYDWNFKHDDHENPAMIHAQMYVKNFEEMKEKT